MASNFVSSHDTWLFPRAWKPQPTALLYIFALKLQSLSVNMSVIANAQSLGVFLQMLDHVINIVNIFIYITSSFTLSAFK